MSATEKKCPFCGGDPFLETKWSAEKEVTFMYVKCQKCGASGKAYATNKRIVDHEDMFEDGDLMRVGLMAIDAWNWRTDGRA